MTWLRGLTKRRLWALAAIAFFVGVVEFLPAYPFEDRINRALPPPWHLSVSGTIWDGFGVLQAGQTTDALTVPLTWKFDLPALARLRMAWKIVPMSALFSGQVKVGAGWDSLEFRDAALVVDMNALGVDANAISRAFPPLALFAPWGKFLVSIPEDAGLTVGYGNDLRINGSGRIKVDNFGLRPFSDIAFGNYDLKVTAHDTTIDYLFIESSGALKLEGGGSIQTAAPRQIVYAGQVTPSPALPDNVLSQLKSLGQPAADGRLHVDWRARW